jgi:hypothetical protein
MVCWQVLRELQQGIVQLKLMWPFPGCPRVQAIEAATGHRTCIVYGALPAETRRAQVMTQT